MLEPLEEETKGNFEIPQENSPMEAGEIKTDENVNPSPPLDTKLAANLFSSYKTPSNKSNPSLSNSFAPPTGHSDTTAAGSINPLYSSNRQDFSAAPDVNLIMQPLITTPSAMQLATLLRNENDGSYCQGFTPQPIPTQGSVTTNGTAFSNTPFPAGYPSSTSTGRSLYHTPGFALTSTGRSYHRTPGLPLSASTTTSHSHPGSNSSLGFRNQARIAKVSFDFTPVMHAAPNQQFPNPSPIFPLSSRQTAALGYSHVPANKNNTPLHTVPANKNNTPLHQFARHAKKNIETLAKAHKARSVNKHVAKPVARTQQVDVSAVMTMDTSTRPCRCPKNQCVKLYCECFQRGQICDPNECICKKCLNTEAESGANGVRTKSVQQLLTRKGPEAFIVKPKKTGVGCSCKKSR